MINVCIEGVTQPLFVLCAYPILKLWNTFSSLATMQDAFGSGYVGILMIIILRPTQRIYRRLVMVLLNAPYSSLYHCLHFKWHLECYECLQSYKQNSNYNQYYCNFQASRLKCLTPETTIIFVPHLPWMTSFCLKPLIPLFDCLVLPPSRRSFSNLLLKVGLNLTAMELSPQVMTRLDVEESLMIILELWCLLPSEVSSVPLLFLC